MSSTASNYDLSMLAYGTILAVLSMKFSLATCLSTLSTLTSSVYMFVSITLTYGVMMFASSYIEEEHHFWYWTASAWMVYLFKKG